MDKIFMHILIVLLVGIGVITLIQLWVPFISWDIYLKLIASCIIVAIITGLILALKADLGYKKKMKDENYLD